MIAPTSRCLHINQDVELVDDIEMTVCRDCYRVLSKRKVEL